MYKDKAIFTMGKHTKGKNQIIFSIEKLVCSIRDTPRHMVKTCQPLQVKPPNLINNFSLPDLTENFGPLIAVSYPNIMDLTTVQIFALAIKLPRKIVNQNKERLSTRVSLREIERPNSSYFTSSLSKCLEIIFTRECELVSREWDQAAFM